MNTFTRLGVALIAVGAFLMLSTISPLGLVLIMLGAPLVFYRATAQALRERR